MIVYRLAQEQYAHLRASGIPNRWNRAEQYVLYASESVSLCALELLAHTSGTRPSGTFKIMSINVDDSAKILEIDTKTLPSDWQRLSAYHLTQKMGSEWYDAMECLLLKIPSAIVPTEWNYAINTRHEDFSRLVGLQGTVDFFWDHRFPSD